LIVSQLKPWRFLAYKSTESWYESRSVKNPSFGLNAYRKYQYSVRRSSWCLELLQKNENYCKDEFNLDLLVGGQIRSYIKKCFSVFSSAYLFATWIIKF